jgi:uncharacterized membrane protein SirB2
MSYTSLKMIHIASVVISYLFFSLRGVWMMQGSPALHQRWVRITPHFVDTVLLGSAIGLAFTIHQDPINNAWLSAKIAGLFLYVGLGMFALRHGKTRRIRIFSWLGAQAVFFYIVLVALTKNPAVFFHFS